MPAVTVIEALKQSAGNERTRHDATAKPKDGFAATLDRTIDDAAVNHEQRPDASTPKATDNDAPSSTAPKPATDADTATVADTDTSSDATTTAEVAASLMASALDPSAPLAAQPITTAAVATNTISAVTTPAMTPAAKSTDLLIAPVKTGKIDESGILAGSSTAGSNTPNATASFMGKADAKDVPAIIDDSALALAPMATTDAVALPTSSPASAPLNPSVGTVATEQAATTTVEAFAPVSAPSPKVPRPSGATNAVNADDQPTLSADLPGALTDIELSSAIAAVAPTVGPAAAATASTAMTGVTKSAGSTAKGTSSEIGTVAADIMHADTIPVSASAAQAIAPAQHAQTPPQSAAVLAQNALAADGNAMEKAVSQQVSRALVQHLPSGDRMMVVRLTPPELGTVRIEVIERQGVLSARLHAEDDGVRLALERFLPTMRQELRASDAPIRELTLADQSQFQRSFADGQGRNADPQADQPGRRLDDDEPRFSVDGTRSSPIPVRSAQLGSRINGNAVDALA